MKLLLLLLTPLMLLANRPLSLQGIILTPHATTKELDTSVQGIVFKGADPLPSLEEKLHGYLGKEITPEAIAEIQQCILQEYRKEGYSLVTQKVPDQDLSSGILTVEVHNAEASSVTYTHTKWFPQKLFEKKIPLQIGEEINEDFLSNRVAFLNRNPFHSTQIDLSPGETAGTTHVHFITKERVPVRIYSGIDNTGTEFTDQGRLFFGLNWGNAFWIDDLLTVQYTVSPDFHRYFSIFANYTSYLPYQHELSIFGGYSVIFPNIPDFHSKGKDSQASVRYKIPFKPLYTHFLKECSFGFDFKNFNNDLFFTSVLDVPVIRKTVNIAQFTFDLGLYHESRQNDVNFYLQIFGSPAQWLPHQSHADYEALRPSSSPFYAYGRASLETTHEFQHGLSVLGMIRGQIATGPLLASEQFGLGGHDTVRGYKERAFNADDAVCINVELRETFSFWKRNSEFTLLGFLDLGWGYNKDATDDLPTRQYLLGVGPGIRFKANRFVALRADYGFLLHSIFGDDQFGRFNLGGIVSF